MADDDPLIEVEIVTVGVDTGPHGTTTIPARCNPVHRAWLAERDRAARIPKLIPRESEISSEQLAEQVATSTAHFTALMSEHEAADALWMIRNNQARGVPFGSSYGPNDEGERPGVKRPRLIKVSK